MSAPIVSGRFMTPVELDGRLTQHQKDNATHRTHRQRTRHQRHTNRIRGRQVTGEQGTEMSTGYELGRNVEWDVIHHLTENGYDCVRASSSKGFADVVAVKPGEALFVNVKRTRPPGPDERADLLRVAGCINALPLVALRPPRCRLRFRLLTGPGPNDWRTWVADYALRCQVCGEPADDAVCAGCGGAA